MTARILVVDDITANRRLLEAKLQSEFYEVALAQSGAEALEQAASWSPDIILLDVMMPGMDGFETCRALKADEALAHIPVIFMTGLTDSDHVVKGLEAGGVDYVTKPIDPKALLARIKVHLANARIAHGAQAALDTTGRHLFAADEEGRLLWWTPQGGRILARVLNTRPAAGTALPAAVGDLIAEAAAGATPSTVVITPASDAGAAIEVGVVGRVGQGEFLLRLVSEVRAAIDGGLKDRLHVSDREAQVLTWIAQGKSNRDIGEILGLSPRTINKHLERIFKKIGVENRTSAAVMVLKAAEGVDGS